MIANMVDYNLMFFNFFNNFVASLSIYWTALPIDTYFHDFIDEKLIYL